MDTISLVSTIQTLTNNFKADDVTDYSGITYFSDSKSCLKLQGPSATIYNNTNFATPDFDYPGTLTKDITIPLIGGAIPQGSYILTATTRVYKTGVPISSVTFGTNTILVPLILDGNFIPTQTVTWSGGNNAGTYTVLSATTTAFGVEVTFVEGLIDDTSTGSLSFYETITTVESYTYCYTAPSTVLTLSADCPTATLDATNDTNYAISCEGQTIQPDSVTATLTLNAPLNASGSPVYAQTVTALPSGSTYSTTELWTQTWTGTLVSAITYTLPSGLQIETTITGTTSLNVSCDDSLCCMSSCLQNATNGFTTAVTTSGGDLNRILTATRIYTQILGQFMMYSVGVRCGDTDTIDTAVAAMKVLLGDQNCCNNCSDTGESVQIVAIYNVNVSGNTVVVQSGDVYIDVSAAVVGSTTTYTLTLDTTQLGNLISTYLNANPSVITDIVDTMKLKTSIFPIPTSYDTKIWFTGDTTIGSPVISNIAMVFGSFSDIEIGDPVQDAIALTNLPLDCSVLSLGATSITLNNNATATATGQDFYLATTHSGIAVAKYIRDISGVQFYTWLCQVVNQRSIEADSTTHQLQLVNDQVSPGNIKFYGTDATGLRGWQFIKSSLVEPTDGISCPAGVSTDTTLFTTTAGNAGMYLIVLTGQFTNVIAPTTLSIQLLKNAALINVNAENNFNSAIPGSGFTTFAITTLEQLVDTDLVKLRVTPADQGVVLGNVSVSFVRIA